MFVFLWNVSICRNIQRKGNESKDVDICWSWQHKYMWYCGRFCEHFISFVNLSHYLFFIIHNLPFCVFIGCQQIWASMQFAEKFNVARFSIFSPLSTISPSSNWPFWHLLGNTETTKRWLGWKFYWVWNRCLLKARYVFVTFHILYHLYFMLHVEYREGEAQNNH